MKIFVCEEKTIEVQIDTKSIDCSHIISDEEAIIIPYLDPNFSSTMKVLIEDVIFTKRPAWKEPDCKKSKCYFYIVGDEIDLMVEVLPRRYSAKEKRKMLQAASREARVDGYSDYFDMCDMFDLVDNLINSPDPVGEMCFYRTEVDSTEGKDIFSIIE